LLQLLAILGILRCKHLIFKINKLGVLFMPFGFGNALNPYTMIILILIILQWFRVGSGGLGGSGLGDLQNCGGLFIIALFLLIYCACGRQQILPPIAPVQQTCC
jgi:hypothetical protein